MRCANEECWRSLRLECLGFYTFSGWEDAEGRIFASSRRGTIKCSEAGRCKYGASMHPHVAGRDSTEERHALRQPNLVRLSSAAPKHCFTREITAASDTIRSPLLGIYATYILSDLDNLMAPFVASAERTDGAVHVLLITTGSVASVKAPLIVSELLSVRPQHLRGRVL